MVDLSFKTPEAVRYDVGESASQIRLLEELSLTALPALQTVHYDGWVLRFADGYTRRANSVNPVYDSTLDVEAKICRCEALYAARNAPVVFKMTPLSNPPELDDLLAKRFYREEPGASVQTLSLTTLEKPGTGRVTLSPTVNGDWLNAFQRMNGVPERFMQVLRQMLNNIIPPKCCAALYFNQTVAAVGLGVLDGDYLGLYDIVTDAAYRNRGLGRQLMLYLLNWGKTNGARTAYLQVMPNNAPALHLYGELGFRESYQYWYRVRG